MLTKKDERELEKSIEEREANRQGMTEADKVLREDKKTLLKSKYRRILDEVADAEKVREQFSAFQPNQIGGKFKVYIEAKAKDGDTEESAGDFSNRPNGNLTPAELQTRGHFIEAYYQMKNATAIAKLNAFLNEHNMNPLLPEVKSEVQAERA